MPDTPKTGRRSKIKLAPQTITVPSLDPISPALPASPAPPALEPHYDVTPGLSAPEDLLATPIVPIPRSTPTLYGLRVRSNANLPAVQSFLSHLAAANRHPTTLVFERPEDLRSLRDWSPHSTLVYSPSDLSDPLPDVPHVLVEPRVFSPDPDQTRLEVEAQLTIAGGLEQLGKIPVLGSLAEGSKVLNYKPLVDLAVSKDWPFAFRLMSPQGRPLFDQSGFYAMSWLHAKQPGLKVLFSEAGQRVYPSIDQFFFDLIQIKAALSPFKGYVLGVCLSVESTSLASIEPAYDRLTKWIVAGEDLK